jgi:NAD(P)-dependent dehydrogenase (short-subunit alcohol dehydrogenase family)
MYSKQDIFLVTGGTSGIGKGVVSQLNNLGASVIVVGRDTLKLQSIKKEMKLPENIFCEEQDLAKSDNLDKWILELSRKYGKLKGLVLSAGILEILPLNANTLEKSKNLFEINYFSGMQLIKGFCDKRVNTGDNSSIVWVSSIASIRGYGSISTYSASKGAINSAVKSLAPEIAKSNIRINALLPGFVKTEMIDKHKDIYNDEFINMMEESYPLGIGEIDDVVKPILFLLSDDARWITGTNMVVDGGGSI